MCWLENRPIRFLISRIHNIRTHHLSGVVRYECRNIALIFMRVERSEPDRKCYETIAPLLLLLLLTADDDAEKVRNVSEAGMALVSSDLPVQRQRRLILRIEAKFRTF